ncbi:ABC transporter substrate-binding protein [Roseomonas sp. CCTCC AB2023176]|uniref:ABC transporter substrate-binding protein n=1 Tax=Roseomonas sp. CCTCC AB2023176 TaxID=3342640 RepID=UPI0035DE9F23
MAFQPNVTLTRRALGGAALALAAPAVARAQGRTITVWHDLGDNGIAWFDRLNAEFAKVRPGVTVRSQSFPTDQWFGRVIGAINTGTAPDLIFNNYERVIRIQSQTNKVLDMRAVLEGVEDRSYLSPEDLRVATYRDRMIIIPMQRVQMAFGVRRSWLDRTGETLPDTWDDVKRVAPKFRDNDPDGNGRADTFPFALQAARPRDLIHMLDLLVFGSGLQHTLIDPAGEITITRPEHALVLTEFLRAYSTYRWVPPDTINHGFTEMYQVIEGGRGGMFRVGDWNVRRWDMPNTLGGDFVTGPWPKFFADKPNAVVIGGMRGVGIPENAPDRALSTELARFMLTRPAQQASLETVGSAVRKDLDVSSLSPRGQWFAKADQRLIAYDFPEATHAFYPELEAQFHRRLLAMIGSPPRDLDAAVRTLGREMQETAARLARG